MRTTGQDLRHSCRHFLGLHLSLLTMAIRVSLSDILAGGLDAEWAEWSYRQNRDWLAPGG